ncbi:DUF1573 domain-containing protein [Kordia sp.]|uniref:DUF1573 domain-containing protein n=1 Tax=Kordia sp. TaxID=1965332 RepID=UPI003B5B70DC
MIRKGFILLGAMSLVLFTSCKDDASKKIKSENVAQAAERDAVAKNFAAITFDKTEHDFGTINEGDQVETTFKFTNTGNTPLLISNIKGSCGCTVPKDYPTTPIAPGDSGKFTVKYNSTNKPNLKTNTVTVTANTEKGREIVRIKAFATPNPELEAKRAKAKADREARMKAQQEAQKAASAKTEAGHNH